MLYVLEFLLVGIFKIYEFENVAISDISRGNLIIETTSKNTNY
jgi:hypothetical protein